MFLFLIENISEQPCSNADSVRDVVLWEVIRTVHKTTRAPPMGHVPVAIFQTEYPHLDFDACETSGEPGATSESKKASES